jgi:Domain of unknown function (DUF4272)
LLWVINKIDSLDLPDKEVNLNNVIPFLPGFLEPTGDFIKEATIRSVSEILDQSDFTFRLNWALTEAQTHGSEILAVNPSVAYERYFSISWVTRSEEEWEKDS